MRKRKKYIGYDYENLHTKLLDEEILENEIDQVIDVTKGCIYETKTITSGVIREVEIYPTFTKKEVPPEWKIEKSREAQSRLNDKNARKYFTRKINTNFKTGDYFVTLTYSNKNLPKDYDRAKKDMRNYVDRLNRIYRKVQFKAGVHKSKIERIKYIYVTEHSETKNKIRCHHHIIMNSVLPMETIESAWKLGRRNNIRKLEADELHLTGLASYLSKDPKGKKRWCSSRNLKEPKLTVSASKYSKKKINKMTRHQYLIKEEMERNNPGYIFIDSQVRINEFNGKPYIYARMRKLN